MPKYIIRPSSKTKKELKHRTKLNDILVERNISQTKLANETKLMDGQVSLIVLGMQSDMLLSTAKRICNYLEISLDELWGEGGVDYKTQVLNYIEKEKERLDKNDVHGEIWLEKFKRFTLTLKP